MVMELFKVDDGGREKMKPVVHPSYSFYEHTDDQFGPIHEDYYNLFVEENSLYVASLSYGDFEEVFRSPLFDEYEDRFLEYEGPKWDVSSCSSNT